MNDLVVMGRVALDEQARPKADPHQTEDEQDLPAHPDVTGRAREQSARHYASSTEASGCAVTAAVLPCAVSP